MNKKKPQFTVCASGDTVLAKLAASCGHKLPVSPQQVPVHVTTHYTYQNKIHLCQKHHHLNPLHSHQITDL